jgi:hypothetical protein
MAIIDSTISPADAPPPQEIANEGKPLHVLLAPNVTRRLDGISSHGFNLADIAGLLELCSEDIAKEARAVQRLCPEALLDHTLALTDHIGYLVERLRDMGEAIVKEADEAGQVVTMMTGGSAEGGDHGQA